MNRMKEAPPLVDRFPALRRLEPKARRGRSRSFSNCRPPNAARPAWRWCWPIMASMSRSATFAT